MARLNLTLDENEFSALARHAERAGKPQATVAREMIQGALRELAMREKNERLARDYTEGRADARALLAEMAAGQVNVGREDD